VVRRLLDIISFSFTDFERQVSKSQADCTPPAFMVADWRLRKGSTVSFRNRWAVHERADHGWTRPRSNFCVGAERCSDLSGHRLS
jgi:hypothetical protein